MATKKFTFKANKATGKFASFYNYDHDILYKKINVGSIHYEAPFTIRLKVEKANITEDGNPNCSWKWITLKGEHESLQAAKDWLNANADRLFATYPISIEDWHTFGYIPGKSGYSILNRGRMPKEGQLVRVVFGTKEGKLDPGESDCYWTKEGMDWTAEIIPLKWIASSNSETK
jgi:hypothetical protein